ncbi:hypothetical protein ABXS96_13940, partial [Flavobacterium covae]
VLLILQMGYYKLTYNPLQIVRRHEPKPSREAKVVQCWMSIDPLAEEYPNVSPYAYCLNNPIIYIDPDGRKVVVAQESDRALMMGYLDKIYGANNFTFDKNGVLSFTGSTKGMSRDQKNSLKLMNEAIGTNYDINIKLSNFSEEESKMLNPQSNVLASEGGALSLISVNDKGEVVGASILMDPSKLTDVPIFETAYIYKNADGTVTTGASSCPSGTQCFESYSAVLNNGKSTTAPKSAEATIIHEIAHPIYEGKNQKNVLKAENTVRDILKIQRRSEADPEHNSQSH